LLALLYSSRYLSGRRRTQNETTFASSVELVLIPTVVTVVKDKSGVHIAGLQKEEFDLKQDRKTLRKRANAKQLVQDQESPLFPDGRKT
jgi:hypothetical protein